MTNQDWYDLQAEKAERSYQAQFEKGEIPIQPKPDKPVQDNLEEKLKPIILSVLESVCPPKPNLCPFTKAPSYEERLDKCAECYSLVILSAIQSTGWKSPEEYNEAVGLICANCETLPRAGYVLPAENQTPPESIATLISVGLVTGGTKFFNQMATPVLNPDGKTYRVWAAVTVTKEQLERMGKCWHSVTGYQ